MISITHSHTTVGHPRTCTHTAQSRTPTVNKEKGVDLVAKVADVPHTNDVTKALWTLCYAYEPVMRQCPIVQHTLQVGMKWMEFMCDTHQTVCKRHDYIR